MCSQKAVRLLVTKNLDEAVCVIVALGAAVGQQREVAHFVLYTLWEQHVHQNGSQCGTI